MLKFQEVSKKYLDGTEALKTVSFEVPPSQFCVILGSSGAGKSTLLKMVNGLISPSTGSISVNQIPVIPQRIKSIRQQVAMIHQQFNLVGRLSVEKNIMTGALREMNIIQKLLHSFPIDLRRRACQIMESVGLEEKHLNRRVTELSGGQQQRVGIARAFILNPSLILADEPVASLDPRISRDILSILKRSASEKGATVLCSLHQLDLAREFADRIVAFKHGQIIFDGAPDDLKESVIEKTYELDDQGLNEE